MSKALTFSKQSGGNIEHNNRTEKSIVIILIKNVLKKILH